MKLNFRRIDWYTASILAGVAVLCLCGALALFARQNGSAPPVAVKPAAGPEVLRVETATLAAEPLEVEFTRRATLQPSGELKLFPEVTGRVLKRQAGVGDAVKAGDVLFELDGSLLEIKLAEAQSRLKTAQVRLQEAQTQLADAEKTDDADLKRDAGLRRDAAEAALKTAESQAAEAQRTYDARIVRSPLDGTMAQTFAGVGEFADPSQPLAEIIVADPIRAAVPLTAQEAAGLRGEVECRVVLPTGESGSLPARLVRIAPVADPRTKRISVEVEAKNEAGRLHAGMPVDVAFRAKSFEAALLLPRRALTLRGQSLVCFRIDKASGGHVARQVEPVLESIPGRPQSLKVLGGLAAGDVVAVSGMVAIEDGSAVEPASGAAAPATAHLGRR